MDNSSKLKIMEKIENISVGAMPESQFLQPLRMLFKQNGQDRYWDLVKTHDSVSIILFNTSRNVFIFVKQFRPAVFYSAVVGLLRKDSLDSIEWEKFPAKYGITLELCAGILDNPKLTVKEIAQQEVLEECGYDVPLENFEFMHNSLSAVGFGGNKGAMFFAEVTDNMKVNSGGGKPEEGELIEVIEMTIKEVREYITQETVLSPSGFMYAVTWFLMNKAPIYEIQI